MYLAPLLASQISLISPNHVSTPHPGRDKGVRKILRAIAVGPSVSLFMSPTMLRTVYPPPILLITLYNTIEGCVAKVEVGKCFFLLFLLRSVFSPVLFSKQTAQN